MLPETRPAVGIYDAKAGLSPWKIEVPGLDQWLTDPGHPRFWGSRTVQFRSYVPTCFRETGSVPGAGSVRLFFLSF